MFSGYFGNFLFTPVFSILCLCFTSSAKVSPRKVSLSSKISTALNVLDSPSLHFTPRTHSDQRWLASLSYTSCPFPLSSSESRVLAGGSGLYLSCAEWSRGRGWCCTFILRLSGAESTGDIWKGFRVSALLSLLGNDSWTFFVVFGSCHICLTERESLGWHTVGRL